ncbi:MAG TPA: phosphatidate cytidylyltransferase [Bacilli bacterium]|nr:phosphatidate cytidylyltransferase [Bacilli bacterium]
MLKQRVITGLLGGAVYLAATWYGGIPFALLVAVLTVVGYSELVRMKGLPRLSLPAVYGYLLTLFLLLGSTFVVTKSSWVTSDQVLIPFLLFALFGFLAISVISKNKYTYQDISFLFAGALYVGLPFHAALLLRVDPQRGLAYFLFVQVAIWATDTFAYFVGRAIKGPKVWPAISPNKTISGTVGGIVGAMVVGAVFAQVMDLAWGPWILLAAVLSVVGQLGDFVESGLKRSFDVKDSGTLLPGHGGVLDRFDSILFAAPVAYYAILWLM